MKRLFLLSVIYFIIFNCNAQTYYWIGGSGSWNNLSRWASSSGGPGNAFTQIPQSFNDVVFDNNSGLTTGSTITLSTSTGSNITCRNLTFNTGANIILNGSTQADIYGSLNLQTGMNVSSWSGDITFLSSGNETHEFRALQMVNNNISFEPTGANHTVNNFRQGDVKYLFLRQGNGKTVNFQGSFVGGSIRVISGTTNINTVMQGSSTAGRVRDLNITGGTININFNALLNTVTLNGTASSNATLNMIGNTHEMLDFNYYPSSQGTLNISNAIINLANWDVRNSSINFISNGSVMNFNLGSVGSFQGANEIYNEVNFRIFTNLRALNGFPNATFNTVRFFKGVRVFELDLSYTCHNLLRIESGGLYNASGDRDEYSPPYLSFIPQSNCITQLVGSCRQKLFLRRMRFNFAAGAELGLQSNHVKMDDVIASGPAAPSYQAGSNSYAVPGTGVGGWLAGLNPIGLPNARQLRWVVSSPSNRWTDFNSWQDITTGIIGQCPPTLNDNVTFPAGSVVIADSAAIECHDMIWLGSGSFTNANYSFNYALLEVYGNLEWSNSMTLSYNGVIKMRSWENTSTIRSNGKNFPFKLVIETTDLQSDYLLLDTLRVPNNFAVEYSLILFRGGLNTNKKPVFVNNFTTYRTNNIRRLSIDSSNFYVRSRYLGGTSSYLYGFEVNSASSNLTISAKNSHIHIQDSINGTLTRMVMGSGHRLDTVTFYGPTPIFDRSYQGHTYVNQLNFIQGGSYISTINSTDTIHLLRTNIQNIVNTFTLTENNGTANSSANLIVDSAFYFGNTSYNRNISYRQLMFLNPGSTFTIGHASLFTQELLGSARLSAQGTCIKNIKINGGNFISSIAQIGNHLILTDNTASGAVFNYTNSIVNGNTGGWIGIGNLPRKLYWFDGIAGNSKGSWGQNRNWSLADGMMLDAFGGNNPSVGNCPPTRIDTVFFTTGSFMGAADTVEIALDPNSAECADMLWTHNTTVNPVLKASNTEQLDLYGSLQFSRTMRQNMLGNVFFLGNPTVRNITSNGQQFNLKTIFNAPGATWVLQDSFRSNAFVSPFLSPNTYPHTFELRQGTFNTNNQKVTVESFGSTVSTPRSLILGSSQFIVTGAYVNGGGTSRYPYHVSNPGFSVNAGTSTIIFTNAYAGNSLFVPYTRMYPGDNTSYHNIEISSSNSFLGIYARNFSANNVSFAGGGFIGTDFGRYNKITGISTQLLLPLIIEGSQGRIDSLIMLGHGEFRSSNRYNKLLRLSPAKNYTFIADSTQHIGNSANFSAIGIGGGGEIFFSSTATNSQSYIQKDSGQICVDFIYLRDIWAIGNGLSTQTSCNSRLCDTAQISSDLPTRATSGRALFQAGANANDQGNNRGWDFTAYPPVPSFVAIPGDTLYCPGDTFQALFSLTGQQPINISFSYRVNGTLVIVDSFDVTPISGNGTALNPYIWGINTILDTIITNASVEAISINSERCFNNSALGSGILNGSAINCILLNSRFLKTDAICLNNSIKLSWETAITPNTLSYVVERSSDAIVFENLATLSNSASNYEFADNNPSNGLNYYRIKAIDADNSINYSNVFVADCDNDDKFEIRLLSNPSSAESIGFTLSGNINGSVDVSLYDAFGRILEQNSLTVPNCVLVPKTSLAPGLYYLSIQQDNWRKVLKVSIR